MRPVLLSTLILAGCLGGESFRIRDASCPADFTDWTGGLTYHLLQGSGDGSFSYDPEGDVEREISGEYDLSTGDFEWDVTYAPAHYRTSTQVDGYGYANTNGDLDVLYTVVDTDVLGASRSTEIRTIREGCEVDQLRRVDGAGYDIVHSGTYAAGLYVYEDTVEVGSYSYALEGSLRSDHTLEADLEQTDSDYEYTGQRTADLLEGSSRTDWEHRVLAEDLIYAGYDETWMDGREHRHYSVDYEGDTITWDYTVDYRGNGTGTYSQSGLQCDMTYQSWSCTMECSNGNTYEC